MAGYVDGDMPPPIFCVADELDTLDSLRKYVLRSLEEEDVELVRKCLETALEAKVLNRRQKESPALGGAKRETLQRQF